MPRGARGGRGDSSRYDVGVAARGDGREMGKELRVVGMFFSRKDVYLCNLGWLTMSGGCWNGMLTSVGTCSTSCSLRSLCITTNYIHKPSMGHIS